MGSRYICSISARRRHVLRDVVRGVCCCLVTDMLNPRPLLLGGHGTGVGSAPPSPERWPPHEERDQRPWNGREVRVHGPEGALGSRSATNALRSAHDLMHISEMRVCSLWRRVCDENGGECVNTMSDATPRARSPMG